MTISPEIRPMGLTGMLVTFAAELSDGANRAALAFRAGVEAEDWGWVVETTVSLTSTLVLFDPLAIAQNEVRDRLETLLSARDWTTAPWPPNRRRWHVPASFEGADAPQLAEAADLAKITQEQAVADICSSSLRVLTLGFAPGQPYLGSLPARWNIPRQTGLTAQVPEGAITVAIRQIVLFANPSPTGWRQVGRCRFPLYRPDQSRVFSVLPGDEVAFFAVNSEQLETRAAEDATGYGGAWFEALPDSASEVSQ